MFRTKSKPDNSEFSSLSTKEQITPEKVFKYVNFSVLFILLFCIKGFLTFREYCQSRGYYVFSIDSLSWCGIGFFCMFIAKYGYFHFMRNKIEKIVHPKYQGQIRQRKTQFILKLSFDSCFYFFTTFMAYVFFRNQYWFPSVIGGCGECSKLYKDYPNWPQNKRLQLQIYFLVQLGVHIFSVFEMVVIKRKTEKKFHQYLLHHFIAVSLILFSTMSNQIVPGIMTIIVHDMSDIIMAGARALLQTKYQRKHLNSALYLLLLAVWIFCRILVFPFCILANVYINTPLSTDQWYLISFQYKYLLTMAFVLLGMHIYWTYYLLKVGINSIIKKKMTNVHEKNQQ